MKGGGIMKMAQGANDVAQQQKKLLGESRSNEPWVPR
jgi:hypothetical protein